MSKRFKSGKKTSISRKTLAVRPKYKPNRKVTSGPKQFFDLQRSLILLFSLILAAKGQWDWVAIGQSNSLWTGLAFYTVAVGLFLFAFYPWSKENLGSLEIPPLVEWGAFVLILAIAAFYRIYRLDEIPNGIFMDQGFEGLGGLMIGHNDFQQPVYSLGDQPVFEVGKSFWQQPFFIGKPLEAPAYLLYLLAVWFKFFQPTQFTLYLFFACLALASFPLIYWTFRQVAGPRMALLTLYFLAVMRWHVNFSRNGFPTIEVPFYMFGTLAFLLYGYRKGKTWAFCVSAVFLSLGLYTYQAFKIFPLLLAVYALYEFLRDNPKVEGLIKRPNKSNRKTKFPAWVIPSIVTLVVLGVLGIGLGHLPSWYLYLTSHSLIFNLAKIVFGLATLGIMGFILYLFTGSQKFTKHLRQAGIFFGILLFLTAPILYNIVKTGSLGSREGSDNILGTILQEHSFYGPVSKMLGKTLLMCNRMGDDNERHNMPNHRMMDDISGTLLILGVGYALSRIYRRKYFYALSGLGIMSLACLLSVVPAHANRLLATTPFLCLLIAAPLAALWGRIRQQWGSIGEIAFLLLLIEPLLLVGFMNYKFYFIEEPKDGAYWNSSYWGGYSFDASQVGKLIAQTGDTYDYSLTKRYYYHNSVKFLTYGLKDHVKLFTLPESLAPLQSAPNRGILYAFMAEQKGLAQNIQALYPHSQFEPIPNPNGQPLVYSVRVPAEDVNQAKGLVMRTPDGKTSNLTAFPEGLPAGPYQAILQGSLFLDRTTSYVFDIKSNAKITGSIGSHKIRSGQALPFAKGFYRVELRLTAPAGPVSLQLLSKAGINAPVTLGNSSFTTLDLARGLKGSYYDQDQDSVGLPLVQQWDPFINFSDSSDFPYVNSRESIRWAGTLTAPATGTYRFLARTDEFAKVIIDGKEVAPWMRGGSTGSALLTAGSHRMEVFFQKILGPSLTLCWMPPGTKDMEVIPNHCFGYTD
jgi:hypothetical protein